ENGFWPGAEQWDILRQLVGMPSNPRSSNGTHANPNEIKHLAAKGERESDNRKWVLARYRLWCRRARSTSVPAAPYAGREGRLRPRSSCHFPRGVNKKGASFSRRPVLPEAGGNFPLRQFRALARSLARRRGWPPRGS